MSNLPVVMAARWSKRPGGRPARTHFVAYPYRAEGPALCGVTVPGPYTAAVAWSHELTGSACAACLREAQRIHAVLPGGRDAATAEG